MGAHLRIQEGLARRVREEGARLGRRNSCSRSTVARWLAQQAEPSPDYLAALEAVFGCPASSLGIVEDWSAPGTFPAPVGAASVMLAPYSPADGGLVVEDDAAAMRAFRKADLCVGGGHLYASVVGYLKTRIAPRLVTSAGRGIFTSAAAVSEMAGWMSYDAGRDQLAAQHFRRALDLVSVGGDRQVRAHVLASAGHLAHHLGDAGGAMRAVRAGLEALSGGPRCPDLEAHLRCIEARGLGSAIVVAQLVTLTRLLEPFRSDAAVVAFLEGLGPALRERYWLSDALANGGDHDTPHPAL
jgi:transcriptional regulator with XRE-family HTH domain